MFVFIFYSDEGVSSTVVAQTSNAADMEDVWRIDVATASGSAIIVEDPSEYWPRLRATRRTRFQGLLKKFVALKNVPSVMMKMAHSVQ